MTSPQELSRDLTELLGLAEAPLGIVFVSAPRDGVARHVSTMPEPTDDGRTGAVPASCVFWVEAAAATAPFATVEADHGNCSVGALTHGFKTLEEAAEGADVAALVASNWVTPEVFPHIPTVSEKPGSIIYGRLEQLDETPDVVFLRLNGKQAMMLHDAWPEARFEGKPQCHIIPIAKEHDQVAISVGCMLSRVRTGMSNHEMTCAIPGKRVAELVENLRTARAADTAVAGYAAEDARRFGR